MNTLDTNRNRLPSARINKRFISVTPPVQLLVDSTIVSVMLKHPRASNNLKYNTCIPLERLDTFSSNPPLHLGKVQPVPRLPKVSQGDDEASNWLAHYATNC